MTRFEKMIAKAEAKGRAAGKVARTHPEEALRYNTYRGQLSEAWKRGFAAVAG